MSEGVQTLLAELSAPLATIDFLYFNMGISIETHHCGAYGSKGGKMRFQFCVSDAGERRADDSCIRGRNRCLAASDRTLCSAAPSRWRRQCSLKRYNHIEPRLFP